jgi:membrane protease subunit HflC
MQAYEESLKGGHTRIVLSPNSEFFRYFNGGSAAKPGDGVKAPPAEPSGANAAASR